MIGVPKFNMAAPIEVLITSDVSGQLWNSCIWDLNSGASLSCYKGDATNHRSLCILGGQYLLGASCTKPLINVWALQRREQHQLKMICAGKVNSLTVTHDGTYCVAAVAENIHIWQVCTGNLLVVLTRHYQAVNVIRFTDNGSHFVSGGEDNLVMVWPLASVLTCIHNPSVKPEPLRIWSSHSLPVTDVHVGRGGAQSRVVSSSLDQTCKIWDIVSGDLLQTILFPGSVLSVTMDAAELRVFAGSSSGHVYCVHLYGQPIKFERHVEDQDPEGVICYKGHSKQVTCLCVSMDGSKLVSGSHDSSVKIWDIFSGQCIRTLPHKGHVTNTVIVPTPQAVLDPAVKPTLPLQSFKRHLVSERRDDTGADSRVLSLRIPSSLGREQKFEENLFDNQDGSVEMGTSEASKEELKRLKVINRELYTFAVDNILNKQVT